MSVPHILPATTGTDQDFVLFDDAIYRNPTFFPGNLFQPTVSNLSDSTFSDMSTSQLADDMQAADAELNKQYYSLGVSAAEAGALPLGSEAPPYDGQSVYSSFDSDIPRTMGDVYMDSTVTTAAPGFLIHPPTLPYHPQGYHSTPSASPSTISVGAFDGPGSYISGSEAGSVHNSPYTHSLGAEAINAFDPTYVVDPSLISNSPSEQRADPFNRSPYTNIVHSPPTVTSGPSSPRLQRHASGRLSPYRVQPYRRPSTSSVHSWRSANGSPSLGTLEYEHDMFSEHSQGFPRMSPSQMSSTSAPIPRATSATDSVGTMTSGSGHSQKEGKETVCPECNKSFRDLRAHQLTHQLTRPEKCPIATCEYSKKGFARKYDCQRHTLTHYKGTMVCGFCPGSGSPMEKSFNRADVFKRHLMAVHNVEQTPPNGRQKKSGLAGTKLPRSSPSNTTTDPHTGNAFPTGKCSTCSITFQTAQQFYEHLDDCVLSKVVEEEPAAAHNVRNLDSVDLPEDKNTQSSHSTPEDLDDTDLADSDSESEEQEDEKDGTFTITAASRKRKSQR